MVSNGSPSERPKISSLLSLIAETGDRVAAIINADCLLMHYGDFVETIGAKFDSPVGRLNLDLGTLRPTGEHCYGFDGFLSTPDSF